MAPHGDHYLEMMSADTANRAFSVTPDRDLTPLCRQRIIDQQAPVGGFAAVCQQLQCLHCHKTADHARDRAFTVVEAPMKALAPSLSPT